jgi:RsiW-degrading membrane proteinase PrsW (M82 family)
LDILSGAEHPDRFANFLAALVYQDAQDPEKAFYHARREYEAYPGRESRDLALQFAVDLRDRDWIRTVEKSPDFDKDLTATQRRGIAKMRQDWMQIILLMPVAFFENLSARTIVTVLISSFAWMAIFLHGARINRENLTRAWLFLVAFCLGCLSVVAIDLIDYVIRDLYRVAETGDIEYTIVYNILCVGFPEESVKLLFFLPLLPWIVRRNSESDALFAAASVGLGFATIENFNYVESGGTVLVMVRTLLSTTVHFSATGIAGLALARMSTNPRRFFGSFLLAFGFVVAMHGGADALAQLPDLADTLPIQQMLIVFLALQFFRLIGTVYEEGRETVSLTATYLIGNAIVIGSLFLAVVMGSNWIYAMKVMSFAVAANLTLMIIFMMQLHETS